MDRQNPLKGKTGAIIGYGPQTPQLDVGSQYQPYQPPAPGQPAKMTTKNTRIERG